MLEKSSETPLRLFKPVFDMFLTEYSGFTYFLTGSKTHIQTLIQVVQNELQNGLQKLIYFCFFVPETRFSTL